jgi:dihydrofolate synthase/folylpolyglutamate synthase
LSGYQETLDWLFQQLPMYQRVGKVAYKADLNNTIALMEALGQPQDSFKSIHVAGTNGKGSSSHMLAAVFQAAGYKTGLYTSPHLLDFRERIRINGECIPEERVTEFVEKNRNSFTDLGLSFFEMTVGLAFHHFREEKVDIAIVEVGMGGRLDSTNVIDPLISLITNISFDHTEFLGNSLEKIASEKAGIIKAERPIVISEIQSETKAVFKEKAHQLGSNIYFAPEEISYQQSDYSCDLIGKYQTKNLLGVLMVIRLAESLGFNLKSHIQEGLSAVSKLTGLRGRWEIISEDPLTVCDTGHNEDGIKEVIDQIKSYRYRQLHIIWGMVADKDSTAILNLLPKSAIYYFCAADIPRAKDADILKQEALKLGLAGKSYASVAEAYQTAQKNTHHDDFIFVGGSTFIVADFLKHLQEA